MKKNKINVTVTEINMFKLEIFEDEVWDEYNTRCIACGLCNTRCTTCSCFTSMDVIYNESEVYSEKRRLWASCHVDGFTDMAGGYSFRKKMEQELDFKVLHKIYDYKKRFGVNMCIGCGRCDDNYPEYISFANCINKINTKLKGVSNV